MAADSAEAKKARNKTYEKEIARLQVETAYLQAWVQASGARIVIIFQGRDAAGKGGVIKRLVERVRPRVFRVVALPAPSDREKSPMYFQRYMAQLPAAGEVVIFDRSLISKKERARQDAKKAAEKACRQATLKACGYSALKNKHRKSLRPELPDLKVKQVAPTSDRIPYWSRVDEIQDRLAKGCSSPMAI